MCGGWIDLFIKKKAIITISSLCLTLLLSCSRLIAISMSYTHPSQYSIVLAILWHYNRRRELQRLIRWAREKQLEKPLRLYRTRLQDEEIRLNRCQLQYPRLARLAYFIHGLNGLIFPPPSYPQRGSASGYTRRALLQRQTSAG